VRLADHCWVAGFDTTVVPLNLGLSLRLAWVRKIFVHMPLPESRSALSSPASALSNALQQSIQRGFELWVWLRGFWKKAAFFH
jgi:hypothetical protein